LRMGVVGSLTALFLCDWPCFFFGWHARFTSNAHDAWAYKNGIELHFIAPGKPTENAFAESFNSRVHLHNL